MAQELLERVREIEKRLERLEKVVHKIESRYPTEERPLPLSIKDLLDLPDSLRRTMMVVSDLKEATAEECSSKSGRTRSVETIYLNQLVRMGYMTRVRKGRKIYFRPREKTKMLDY